MALRRWILIVLVASAFGGSVALKGLIRRPEVPSGPPVGAARLVSLAPSITEIVYELGQGDRLVGVTRYCVHPADARNKPQIGGYYDPNYEAVAAAKPDLVLTLTEHDEVLPQLRKLGLKSVTVDHTTVPNILSSILEIGKVCGVPEKATALHARLQARLKAIGARTAGRSRPRVLISVSRMADDMSFDRLTIAGSQGYFEELIELAGGTNAYEGVIAFPSLSAEGVLETRPDVIIDLWPDLKEKGGNLESVRKQWNVIPGLKARVEVIGESYAMIPGPRVVLLLEDFARAFHPEAPRD
jgi:iron complex transport system substrate-binding protein